MVRQPFRWRMSLGVVILSLDFFCACEHCGNDRQRFTDTHHSAIACTKCSKFNYLCRRCISNGESKLVKVRVEGGIHTSSSCKYCKDYTQPVLCACGKEIQWIPKKEFDSKFNTNCHNYGKRIYLKQCAGCKQLQFFFASAESTVCKRCNRNDAVTDSEHGADDAVEQESKSCSPPQPQMDTNKLFVRELTEAIAVTFRDVLTNLGLPIANSVMQTTGDGAASLKTEASPVTEPSSQGDWIVAQLRGPVTEMIQSVLRAELIRQAPAVVAVAPVDSAKCVARDANVVETQGSEALTFERMKVLAADFARLDEMTRNLQYNTFVHITPDLVDSIQPVLDDVAQLLAGSSSLDTTQRRMVERDSKRLAQKVSKFLEYLGLRAFPQINDRIEEISGEYREIGDVPTDIADNDGRVESVETLGYLMDCTGHTRTIRRARVNVWRLQHRTESNS